MDKVGNLFDESAIMAATQWYSMKDKFDEIADLPLEFRHEHNTRMNKASKDMIVSAKDVHAWFNHSKLTACKTQK